MDLDGGRKEWPRYRKEAEQTMVRAGMLRKVVLTIVGTVKLWAGEEDSLEHKRC